MRPSKTLSAVFLVLCHCGPLALQAGGQQPPPAAATPPHAAPQAPAGFQLNQLEEAFLDQVLDAWQRESAKIKTFTCSFERWEYNRAFGPGANIPLNKDQGELSFAKPDKGSFRITEVRKWQAKPAPTGEESPAQVQGDWVPQENAVGEHWVCDGKAIYEYRHDQKQLVERPIPPELQGKAIADGPLPFLFGAESERLKQRYWLRVEQQSNQDEIWLQALPKYQADAANYQSVRVILDRQKVLPKFMEVVLPDGNRHVYMFDLANASINAPFDRVRALFSSPRTPLGWKRVVENPPGQQAAQPGQLPR